MKKDTIMGEFDFSYEELRGLEAHYRNMQKKTVIYKIRQTPTYAIELLRRFTTELHLARDNKEAPTERDGLEAEMMRKVN